jgi:hypothetical protein
MDHGGGTTMHELVVVEGILLITTGTRHYADGLELCRRLFVGAVGVAH